MLQQVENLMADNQSVGQRLLIIQYNLASPNDPIYNKHVRIVHWEYGVGHSKNPLR